MRGEPPCFQALPLSSPALGSSSSSCAKGRTINMRMASTTWPARALVASMVWMSKLLMRPSLLISKVPEAPSR